MNTKPKMIDSFRLSSLSMRFSPNDFLFHLYCLYNV